MTFPIALGTRAISRSGVAADEPVEEDRDH
jgi:hypothetical protein